MQGFSSKLTRNNRRRSLGSILKAARARRGLSLEEAEEQTKVPVKYLQALEEGQYQLLPAEAYNIGFIRCYSEILGLKPGRVIELYKEERSRLRVSGQNGTFSPRRVNDWRFLVTPKLLGAAGIVVLFGSVIFYIGLQVKHFTRPPELVITNVPAEFTSTKDSVKLVGSASNGATVTINAEPILVLGDGSFDQDVQLSPGLNEVVVVAKNRIDKEARRTVKVLYLPDLAKAQQSSTKE